MKVIIRENADVPYPGEGMVANRHYPREEMASLLITYNRSIGNDAAALANAEKLKRGDSRCVITGQQLGFLGGPIYTIIKGITCVRYARQHGLIPLFWLATEDHDIAEIDHANSIDHLGNIEKFHLNLPKDGRFVEDLYLTDAHITEINRFFEQIEMEPPISFKAGSSYARSMAALLASLFRGTGLLFVEPHLLRPYAADIIAKELDHADQETNVFFKTEKGLRRKIIKDSSGYHADGANLQIPSLLLQQPERFSANFALRPIIQSALFPTEAYVAGPNEMLYYRSLKELHHYHQVPMPTLVPRDHITFIPPQIAQYLSACNLDPWDSIPAHWNKVFPDLEEGIHIIEGKWSEAVEEQFEGVISEQKIHRSVDTGMKHMRKQIRAKKLDEKGLPTDALHRMRNTLLPREKPQERVLNWWPFEAISREPLVLTLLEQMQHEDAKQLYCYL